MPHIRKLGIRRPRVQAKIVDLNILSLRTIIFAHHRGLKKHHEVLLMLHTKYEIKNYHAIQRILKVLAGSIKPCR